MRPLQGRVLRLRRRCARPHPSPRHGGSVAGRPPGEHPGSSLVMQWLKGTNQKLLNIVQQLGSLHTESLGQGLQSAKAHFLPPMFEV